MDTKKFTERKLTGIFEIVSLTGNVGLVDGRPFAHCHVAVSDADMAVHGGHLVKGRCSATVELVIRAVESKYHKKFDDEVGLKIWQLEDSW
jgi:predicted DNA-binding protein with PD1-like motif